LSVIKPKPSHSYVRRQSGSQKLVDKGGKANKEVNKLKTKSDVKARYPQKVTMDNIHSVKFAITNSLQTSAPISFQQRDSSKHANDSIPYIKKVKFCKISESEISVPTKSKIALGEQSQKREVKIGVKNEVTMELASPVLPPLSDYFTDAEASIPISSPTLSSSIPSEVSLTFPQDTLSPLQVAPTSVSQMEKSSLPHSYPTSSTIYSNSPAEGTSYSRPSESSYQRYLISNASYMREDGSGYSSPESMVSGSDGDSDTQSHILLQRSHTDISDDLMNEGELSVEDRALLNREELDDSSGGNQNFSLEYDWESAKQVVEEEQDSSECGSHTHKSSDAFLLRDKRTQVSCQSGRLKLEIDMRFEPDEDHKSLDGLMMSEQDTESSTCGSKPLSEGAIRSRLDNGSCSSSVVCSHGASEQDYGDNNNIGAVLVVKPDSDITTASIPKESVTYSNPSSAMLEKLSSIESIKKQSIENLASGSVNYSHVENSIGASSLYLDSFRNKGDESTAVSGYDYVGQHSNKSFSYPEVNISLSSSEPLTPIQSRSLPRISHFEDLEYSKYGEFGDPSYQVLPSDQKYMPTSWSNGVNSSMNSPSHVPCSDEERHSHEHDLKSMGGSSTERQSGSSSHGGVTNRGSISNDGKIALEGSVRVRSPSEDEERQSYDSSMKGDRVGVENKVRVESGTVCHKGVDRKGGNDVDGYYGRDSGGGSGGRRKCCENSQGGDDGGDEIGGSGGGGGCSGGDGSSGEGGSRGDGSGNDDGNGGGDVNGREYESGGRGYGGGDESSEEGGDGGGDGSSGGGGDGGGDGSSGGGGEGGGYGNSGGGGDGGGDGSSGGGGDGGGDGDNSSDNEGESSNSDSSSTRESGQRHEEKRKKGGKRDGLDVRVAGGKVAYPIGEEVQKDVMRSVSRAQDSVLDVPEEKLVVSYYTSPPKKLIWLNVFVYCD